MKCICCPRRFSASPPKSGAPPPGPDRHAGARRRPRGDVFSLIGPKKYDVPWKELEKQGWIAAAECIEIRVPLDEPTA